MPFSYVLSYDSSLFYPQTVNGITTWQPVTTNWGWRGTTEAASGYVNWQSNPASCGLGNGNYLIDSNFVYHDPEGAVHPFSGIAIPIDCNGAASNLTGVTSSDGSGYTLTTQFGSGGKVLVTSRSGVVRTPPQRTQTGAATVVDANGNQLTTDGTTFTDTLGVTALTISGTAPSNVNYTYAGPGGTQPKVTVSYVTYNVRTNFACSGINEYPATSVVLVDKITLGDGTFYQFTYEDTYGYTGYKTGRVSSVKLPTGGMITYNYSDGAHGINCQDGSLVLLSRQTPDGTWSYSRNVSGSPQVTTVTAPDSQTSQTVVSFVKDQVSGSYFETQRKVYQGATSWGTLLATTVTCYDASTAMSNCPSTAFSGVTTRRRVYTQFPDSTGKVSEVDTQLNSAGLPTRTDEYDFGSGAAGALTRYTTYVYNGTLGAITDRPSQINVYDSQHTIAQTKFLQDAHGNTTQVSKWVSGTTWLNTNYTYNTNGTVSSVQDPNTNTVNIAYAATGNCAANTFPSKVTFPTVGSVTLTRSMSWDCNGGVQLTATDENNQATTYTYSDSNHTWRPTQISWPDGGSTSFGYTDTPGWFAVGRTDTMSSTQSSTHVTYYDVLGRVRQQVANNDPDGVTYVDTTYDGLGRVASVSNPYRSTGDPTSGVITYAYDNLGRLTTQTQPDGNTISSQYASNCATTTDEAGKKRQSCVDGLGHMISVFEPDSTGALNWETDYSYNALDDLTGVTQKGGAGSSLWRSRGFTYDGLGRMLTAATPEGGTDTYSYVSGSSLCSGVPSNPCSHTDARSVTTTFTYDALNRPLQRIYSDGTPTVGYQYDQTSIWGLTLNNSKGRVTHEYNNNKAERVFSYDKMGRVVNQWDCLPSNCGSTNYSTAFQYDLAGELSQITYPSGRVVTYTNGGALRPTLPSPRLAARPSTITMQAASSTRPRAHSALCRWVTDLRKPSATTIAIS